MKNYEKYETTKKKKKKYVTNTIKPIKPIKIDIFFHSFFLGFDSKSLLCIKFENKSTISLVVFVLVLLLLGVVNYPHPEAKQKHEKNT